MTELNRAAASIYPTNLGIIRYPSMSFLFSRFWRSVEEIRGIIDGDNIPHLVTTPLSSQQFLRFGLLLGRLNYMLSRILSGSQLIVARAAKNRHVTPIVPEKRLDAFANPMVCGSLAPLFFWTTALVEDRQATRLSSRAFLASAPEQPHGFLGVHVLMIANIVAPFFDDAGKVRPILTATLGNRFYPTGTPRMQSHVLAGIKRYRVVHVDIPHALVVCFH